MTLAEQMNSDSAIFFNMAEHGEVITYNYDDVLAVVEPGVSRTSGNTFETSEGTSASGTVWVRVEDIESPAVGDSITLADDTVWEVARIVGASGGIYQLEVVGSENPWGSSNARQNRVT